MTAASNAAARPVARRARLAERIGGFRQWLLLAPGLGWLVAFFIVPLVLIFVVSLGFNLLGDGLRDVLDPKAAK